ncbi:unnamed protein product [Ranitomeya imitator]|uniref:Gamma-glutamyltransferase 7 n=1 Tax=Ranitomeya imitator TaxID=111125 RepID=A0ABN9MDL2_9NEOB|nr:unnamed protein product [Ranitomeya imitator]
MCSKQGGPVNEVRSKQGVPVERSVHSKQVSSIFFITGGVFTSVYFNGITQNASVLNAIPIDASPIPYGIPTVLQGLWSLHQAHGRMPWSELFSPAIHLASQGFLMDNNLHAALQKNQMKTTSSKGLQHLFYDHNGLKSVGATVANVQLANVLEIARTMVDAALPDTLIQKLLSDIDTDREMFRDTLSMVHPMSSDPIGLHLDGMTLFSSSVPSSGGILSSSVQDVYQKHKNMSSATISEMLINTLKTMYRVVGAWPPGTTDNGSAGVRRQQDMAPVGSNVLVADSHGDILVISLTLNSTFGSGFLSPSTGILLSDFVQGAASVASSTVSFWACPSVLLGSDNEVMGLAGRGGSSLPFSLAQVLLSQILLQTDLPESINRTVPNVTPADSDPWLRYFGLQGSEPEAPIAIEVRAEHIHVVMAPSCSCHHAGL